MGRADRPSRLPASVATWVLVVPLALAGIAPPVAERLTAVAASHRDVVVDGTMRTSGPVVSTTSPSLSSEVTVFGLPVSAEVKVTVPGVTPTGEVEVLVDGTAVATAQLGADGSVRVPLPATVAAGRHEVTAVYAGAPTADPPVLPSSASTRPLTVTRTLPAVRTDGTDWLVGRTDPKAVHVQVAGLVGVDPTGTVVAWVNGVRKGSAVLDRSGEAVVRLPTSTKSALVVVTYAGDATYVPWLASPHLLVVR